MTKRVHRVIFISSHPGVAAGASGERIFMLSRSLARLFSLARWQQVRVVTVSSECLRPETPQIRPSGRSLLVSRFSPTRMVEHCCPASLPGRAPPPDRPDRPDRRLPSRRVKHAGPRQLFHFRAVAVDPLREGGPHIDLVLGRRVSAQHAVRPRFARQPVRGFLHREA
jgi:hypothetical protein